MVSIHKNKSRLIEMLKREDIGVIERFSEKAPGNRKWSLSFWRLDDQLSPKWFAKADGPLMSITSMKIFGSSLEDLYERALLNAFKSYLQMVVWDIDASSDSPMSECYAIRELEAPPASYWNPKPDTVWTLKRILKAKKLIQADVEKCKSIEALFLMDALWNG